MIGKNLSGFIPNWPVAIFTMAFLPSSAFSSNVPSTSSGLTERGNSYSCNYDGTMGPASACTCQSGTKNWTIPFRIPRTGFTVKTLNYVIHPDGQVEALDLYLPPSASASTPLVLVVHGGGWGVGSRTDPVDVVVAEELANLGYAVASVDYRLSKATTSSPANQFPAGLQDVRCAVRWLRYNAGSTVQGVALNFNGSKIGAWGGSAGGNLVGMLGTTREVDSVVKFDGSSVSLDSPDCSVGPVGSALGPVAPVGLQYVADYYGNDVISDTRANAQFPADLSDVQNIFQLTSKHPASWYAASSVVQSVFPQNQFWKNMGDLTYSVPPFLIVNGTLDSVVGPQQSADLFMSLSSANLAQQNQNGPVQVGSTAISMSAPNFSSSRAAATYYLLPSYPHNFTPFSMGAMGSAGVELGASTCDFIADLQAYLH